VKAIQYFSDEYLDRCAELSPNEIVKFLDDFRKIHGQQQTPSKLISLKVPGNLLAAFKTKSALNCVKYQTQIKILMQDWVKLNTDQ